MLGPDSQNRRLFVVSTIMDEGTKINTRLIVQVNKPSLTYLIFTKSILGCRILTKKISTYVLVDDVFFKGSLTKLGKLNEGWTKSTSA